MLLNKIKLIGFKSFVDATPILFPSRLVGIVGPNGCGKSNVIDAVRWVMGESAASRLRGEQGTDVIFNGSSGRQPVGQASVELVFDNSDASLGGEYAQYAEIAIRRQVARDGVSTYFLNGTKCRRRDITDIFLGTGLGPRSYAIIQQGNISRIIEAKPEELRQLLEEAAGISKYKERRKETESRIKGARENLERLQDVRLELDKQLATLKRQASAAERFKELKTEQRQTKSELHALRWRAMNEKITSFQQKIVTKETELEAVIAEVRQLETKIEHQRFAHTESVDVFNEQQSHYYRTNSELGKIEQEIKHQKERRQQLTFDFQQAESHWQSLNATLEHDKAQIIRLKETEIALIPQLELAHETSEQTALELEEIEAALNKWQLTWNEFRDQMSKASKTAEVEQANIAQYEQRIVNINNKLQKLEQTFAEINVTSTEDAIVLLQENIEKERQNTQQVQQSLAESKQAAQSQQVKLRELVGLIDSTKHQRQKLEGQKVSLEILQAAALTSGNEKTKQWLAQQGLSDKKRLAQTLQVDAGWEHAVETVLGDFLQSICVEKDSSNHLAKELLEFKQESLSLIYPQSFSISSAKKLAEKVQGLHMPSNFYTIWTAESLEEALKIQATLSPSESVITKEGLWLGNNWMRVAYEKNQSQGILEREKELKRVATEIISTDQTLTQHQMTLDAIEENMHAQQSHAEALQQHYQQTSSRLSQMEADLSVQQRFLDQSTARRDNITQELTEQRIELNQLKRQLSHSRDLWSSALESLDALENQQSTLETEKQEKTSEVQQARQKNQHAKQAFHELTIKVNITETELKTLEKNIAQLQQQFSTLEERKQQLTNYLSKSDTPITLLEEQREQLLENSLIAEQQLSHAREAMNAIEGEQRVVEKRSREVEQNVAGIQSAIQNHRLEMEGLSVRKQTIEEQLLEIERKAEEVLALITEEKTIPQLEDQLEHIDRRIERLGPINLVAIEECKEKEERKTYYDVQNADLEEALMALEDAMQKIDKETRVKFKETYDAVSECFGTLFPKIFGGGKASLELTGTDLLDAGIEVIAQPPGKKNSSIHLLSGGEKTMVAIALVFSIFQLNPAPFCMLDEVDAPLDDANVVRFSELVREMSQKVQFIVITHNKVTMEMMHQLMGVTMHEPGVSRIVSVDIKEAAELVE